MMPLTRHPFFNLTAQRMMKPSLLALSSEMPPETAARLMTRFHVEEAPVVDENGRCIGVVSVESCLTVSGQDDFLSTSESPFAEWQLDTPMAPTSNALENCMRLAITCSPQTFISDIARAMVEEQVQQVLVIDERLRPIGIVSSTELEEAIMLAAETEPENVE